MPQRFPHDDGADLGDNYISGLYSQTPDEMGGLLTHPAYADRCEAERGRPSGGAGRKREEGDGDGWQK